MDGAISESGSLLRWAKQPERHWENRCAYMMSGWKRSHLTYDRGHGCGGERWYGGNASLDAAGLGSQASGALAVGTASGTGLLTGCCTSASSGEGGDGDGWSARTRQPSRRTNGSAGTAVGALLDRSTDIVSSGRTSGGLTGGTTSGHGSCADLGALANSC